MRFLLKGCFALLAASFCLVAYSKDKPKLEEALLDPYQVPEIAGIDHWIHTNPIKITDYRGKVILLHFWTYSSIDAVRTLPEIASLQQKYGPRGLKVISIHTPEFDFEKNLQNVSRAALEHHLVWPIGLDNSYHTWKNFQNNYWPGLYLVNPQGYVVYQHFGAGDNAVTENNIRALLGIAGRVKDKSSRKYSTRQTPETYVGYERAERFVGKKILIADKTAIYVMPNNKLKENHWGFAGAWAVHNDRAEAMEVGARFKINFNAGRVYAVLGPSGKNPVKMRVWLNGKLIKDGKKTGVVKTVEFPDLYQALKLSKQEKGVLEIEALTPGLELYTVTFG